MTAQAYLRFHAGINILRPYHSVERIRHTVHVGPFVKNADGEMEMKKYTYDPKEARKYVGKYAINGYGRSRVKGNSGASELSYVRPIRLVLWEPRVSFVGGR